MIDPLSAFIFDLPKSFESHVDGLDFKTNHELIDDEISKQVSKDELVQ
jgi:hypothetical protein